MVRYCAVLLLVWSCSLGSSVELTQTGGLESRTIAANLPKPPGEYAVGTITYRWTDAAREEIHTESPQDRREIIVQLWYPAEPPSKSTPAPYFPSLDTALSTMRSESEKGRLPAEMLKTFERFANVRTNSYEGARFTRRGRKYPVLVFSPGGNVSRHSYTILMEGLASRGFVVAGISHKHSVVDVFAEGLVVSHGRWTGSGKLKTREEKDEFWKPLAELQAGDASFVLNQLAKLSKSDPDKRFVSRLDMNRVGIIGHSRGVKTVITALANDERFKVGVVYDNQPPMNKLNVEKHQPVLMMRPDNWPQESVSTLDAFFKQRRAVGYDVVVQGAGHLNFSDFPVVSPESAEEKIDARRFYQIMFDYTFNFLNKYLKNEKATLLDEDTRKYPEVKVESFKPSLQTHP
jgi:hypothetical protein